MHLLYLHGFLSEACYLTTTDTTPENSNRPGSMAYYHKQALNVMVMDNCIFVSRIKHIICLFVPIYHILAQLGHLFNI